MYITSTLGDEDDDDGLILDDGQVESDNVEEHKQYKKKLEPVINESNEVKTRRDKKLKGEIVELDYSIIFVGFM